MPLYLQGKAFWEKWPPFPLKSETKGSHYEASKTAPGEGAMFFREERIVKGRGYTSYPKRGMRISKGS